jgi:DNA-binding transcriptional LysR family regulator
MDATGEYWTGLLAFVRTAENGSFTAASRQLGLTPSSVGRAVTRLEQRLGAKLIKRSTRALTLTSQGRQFLEQVAPALDVLTEAEATLGSRRPARGIVRVSASIDLGRTLVATWSADFAREHPGLALELNVTDRLVDLRREGVDVAIRLGSLPPLGVTGEQIGTIGYALVAAPAYLAACETPQTPEDLHAHRCLQYLAIDGAPLKWTFAGSELATAGPFSTDDGGALLSAVLGGAGVAYMLRFAVHAALADGRLIELLPEVPKAELPVSLSHPFGLHPPARVRTVLAFLRSRILQIG